MKIIIGGAMGRMGRELAHAAGEAGIAIACGVDIAYEGQPMDFPMVKTYAEIAVQADALVDFSRADGLPGLLAYAVSAGMPSVLCTTGYTEAEVAAIGEAAGRINQKCDRCRPVRFSRGARALGGTTAAWVTSRSVHDFSRQQHMPSCVKKQAGKGRTSAIRLCPRMPCERKTHAEAVLK